MKAKTDKELTGKWAVVTGASSGIGLCLSRELASRGCAIVMVSNQDCLPECARELSSWFGVEALPVYCDLTREDCVSVITAALSTHGVEPDYLINNAGIFTFKPLNDTPIGKISCYIDLHVRAVTMLSRAFALRFAERGSGRILNMSSMSCWMPMPGLAMYAATKSYIRVLSRALYYELRDAGVSVTAAVPGGIATDLFGLPDNLMKLAVRIGAVQTPEKFARRAIDKMLAGKKQYINGWLNRISIVAVGVLPTWVRMQIKRRMLDRGITR